MNWIQLLVLASAESSLFQDLVVFDFFEEPGETAFHEGEYAVVPRLI